MNIQKRSTLTDHEIGKLSKYGVNIEKHYGLPMDIEWAIDDRGKIFILQARPETVHGADKEIKTEERKDQMDREVLVKGIGVSPGTASGKVRILLKVKEVSNFQPGDILVTEMTTPDWVPAMRIASAVVTNSGGKTCHAAIVSRELGVPCIVGTEKATKVLKDGDMVTVDGQKGHDIQRRCC